MDLIQLTSDYEMKPFDCGDAVLNGTRSIEFVIRLYCVSGFIIRLIDCSEI